MANNYGNLYYNNLPPVLPYEELIKCFENYRNGDMSARDKIICHNLKLVKLLVSRYNIGDKDILFETGIFGLIKAVDSFDISRNKKFTSFAGKCINNEILMYLRKVKADSKVSSLDEPFDENITLLDTLADDRCNIEEDYIEKEGINERDLLKIIVLSLNIREYTIIKNYYGFFGNECLTHAQIGKILFLERTSVTRIIKITLDKLKNILNNPEAFFDSIRRAKKPRSIFEIFWQYNRNEIYNALNSLDIESKFIINIAYGGGVNLDNPKPHPYWNVNISNRFYKIVIPKIEEKLKIERLKKEESVDIDPCDKIRKEKFNEIFEALMRKDLKNAVTFIELYLEENNLKEYRIFISNLLILSIKEEDFTFTRLLRALALISNNHTFNIDKYKEYFYESLREDLEEAKLYLEIITCLNNIQNMNLPIKEYNLAYERVLKNKKR